MLGHVQYRNGEDEALQAIRRFSSKHLGTSIKDLLFYLSVYKTEEQIEDINGGSIHKNAFLEIGVPKQLTKYNKRKSLIVVLVLIPGSVQLHCKQIFS